MFTGIVEAVGEIRAISTPGEDCRLSVAAPGIGGDLSPGQSVSVDGVCLTVEAIEGDVFDVFLSQETRERTALGERATGDRVNLERALPADGRFDGHLVQGHVDGTARITEIESIGEDWWVTYTIPAALDRYLVEKGSVAIDGISLTIAERDEADFSVAIIPETYDRTTVVDRAVGDRVNLEADVIAKYVESMLADRVFEPKSKGN